MPTYKLAEVAVGKLRPDRQNLRVHSKKQLAQLKRSVSRFGLNTPIVTDERYVILAGHARWLVAKELGYSSVSVGVLSGLTEAELRAFALADNRIAENAGWNRPGLAAELNELAPLLAEAGLDIDLTGFDPPEIDALMCDLVDPERDPSDDVPELVRDPVSRRSDVWDLDGHRLCCGDAKEPADFRKLMGRELAAAVFSDPPYNQKIRTVQGRGRIRHREFLEASGELSPEAYTSFLVASLSSAAAFSTAGSIHYVCIDWRHLYEMLTAGRQVYGELKNLVIWMKSTPGQGSFYRSQHELIFVFKNGDAPHVNNIELGRHGRNRSNVWLYPGANSFRAGRLADLALHPTVKPVALVADAMRDCTRRGDIVLDPFIGSGSTIIAAERIGRRGYGLEIDPRYVDAAVRRWETFTKRDAVLRTTDQTFTEVAAARARRRPR